MKILECPKCHNLIAIPHDAKDAVCNSHNPASFLSAEKHCVGVLRRGKVKQAEKLAREIGMDYSKLLNDLLEIKSCG